MILSLSPQRRRQCIRLIKGNAYPGPIKPHWYLPLKAEMENPTSHYSVRCAQEYVRRQQSKIDRLIKSSEIREAVIMASRLYHSKAVKLCAASRAIHGATNKIRKNKQLSTKEKGNRIDKIPSLGMVISSLDDSSVDPLVSLIHRPKKSGGSRPIYSFSVVDRARQHRVALTFGRIVRFDDAQSGVRGRSYLRAQDDAARLIMDERYHFTCELDFENYYLSLTGADILRHYPIPERIVDEVISINGKEKRGRIKTHRNTDTTMQIMDMKRGCLPPGSAVSPIFAYGILEPALRKFQAEWNGVVALVNANDNFLLFAPDRETMRIAINSLRALMNELAAETLTLKQKSTIRHVGIGITFLGQKFRRKPGCSIRSIPAKWKTELGKQFNDKMKAVSEYAKHSRTIAMHEWHAMLLWLQAKLRTHHAAKSDWVELVSSLLGRINLFAAKHRLRTVEWQKFARNFDMSPQWRFVPADNMCRGEPPKLTDRRMDALMDQLNADRVKRRQFRRTTINHVRKKYGANSEQMQLLVRMLA